MALDLTTIQGVLLDMDGVLWRGAEVIPAAVDFINFLVERGIPYGMASNNTTKSVAEYVARCQSMGIAVRPDQVITSAIVTADELDRNFPPGTPIYVIGMDSFKALLTGRGYPIEPDRAEVVIVGLDIHVTYDKLAVAMRRLLAGADFIGANADASIPTPDGLAPGAGSIVAALERASGRTARLMGKPQPALFHAAVRRLGCSSEQALMIGDRLDTDIQGGQDAGLRTALVLTGVSTRAEIGAIQPDAVYETLLELREQWQQSLSGSAERATR